MEQYNPIHIPQIEEKPHKNNKIAAAVISGCIAVIVTMAVVGVIVVRAYNSDERRFMSGFINLAEEINERKQLWETEAGESLADGGGTQTEMTFNLSGDKLPVTIGFDMSFLRDSSAHEIKSDAVLSVMNNDLISCTIYGDDKRIMLSVPDMLRQNLECSPNQIDRQYNESLLAEKFGRIEIEDISINFFPKDDLLSAGYKDLLETVLELLQNMKNSYSDSAQGISVEKLDGTVIDSFPGKEDRQYECRQYRMVISKEWIESMQDGEDSFNTAEKKVSADISSDAVLLIDMDKNNRIIRISSEKPVQFLVESDGFSGIAGCSINVGFLGEKRSIDDIYVSIETEYAVAMSRWYSGEVKILNQFEAQIGYDENDTRVTIDVSKLEFSNDSIGTFKLTGKIDMEPLKEKIKPLDGETIQIFRITEEEYKDLENQVYKTMMKWWAIISLMN